MFGDAAVTLLKLIGHSGTVPGAIQAEDIPAALDHLTAALAEVEEKRQGYTVRNETDEDEEPVIRISTRALPLSDILAAAAKAGASVMW
jgi:hypothetical protein